MMAIDCAANSLRSKLDNLSIDSSPENPQDPLNAPQPVSTKSLLSKSLAGENYTSPQNKPHFYDDLHDFHNGHPEPNILATSVGKDHDGRLIPSSSTISLLSLSNNGNGGPVFATHSEAHNPTKPSGFTHNPERVNSYTNLRSRNSITHLGQQRLQPYHKLSSPVMPPVGDFNSISSPKNIPWGKNQMATPDSPNLHPTSIGESPSRFWLSAHTPPKSLSNAMSKSRTQIIGHGGLGLQNTQAINIASGSDSPVLNPVQTPSEDLPMTPLYLSSEGGYFASHGAKGFGGRRMDYFFGASQSVPEEKEQLADSGDVSME